jgi:hypothetical protein
MKLTIPFALLIVLTIAATAFSQDWSRLEHSADDVKDTAEKLADSTSASFQKGRQNSSDAIEHAFLAEQVLAASRYMKKVIGDKYLIGDLRLAGNVLSELSERFPSNGDSGWANLKDKIDSLVFELGRDVGGTSEPVTYGKDVDGPDVDKSRVLGRFFWNGEIDDELQLAIRSTTITQRTITGRTMPDGSYSFTSALPRENGIIVRVKILDGRGKAVVIQQPNASNDFSSAVRIKDEDGGAKPYSLEIYWYKSGN